MYGILTEIWNEVAQMPTQHSWAAKIMALPSEEMDEKEEQVNKWVQKTMEKKFPNSGLAERIVREVWPAVMEQEAIEAYLDEHPGKMRVLSAMDPGTGASVGRMEVMASVEETEIARQFLEKMVEDEIEPPLEQILTQPFKSSRMF